jgi:hypothetical protein
MDQARAGKSGSDRAVKQLIEMMRMDNLHACPTKEKKELPHKPKLNAGSPVHDEIRNARTANLGFQGSPLVERAQKDPVAVPVQVGSQTESVHLRSPGDERPRDLHNNTLIAVPGVGKCGTRLTNV